MIHARTSISSMMLKKIWMYKRCMRIPFKTHLHSWFYKDRNEAQGLCEVKEPFKATMSALELKIHCFCRNAEVYILKTRSTWNCVLFVILVVANSFFFLTISTNTVTFSVTRTQFLLITCNLKLRKYSSNLFLFERFDGDYCCHCQSMNQCFRNKEQKVYSSSRQNIFTPVFFPPNYPTYTKMVRHLYIPTMFPGRLTVSDAEAAATPIAQDQCIKGTMVASDSKQQDKNKTMPTCTYRICIFQYIVLRCVG